MIPNSAHDRNRRDFQAWQEGRNLLELVISLLALAAAMILFSRFIHYVETRPGVSFSDPLLSIIPPADVTVPIFLLVYGGIALALISRARHPRELLHTLHAYTLLVMVRIVAMFLLPLAPPPGMVTLIDPVYSLGPGIIITRDLFFSGHTAMLALLAFTARDPRWRLAFTLGAIAMAILLLLQHCHYSIDILAAPFFAYGCVRITRGTSSPSLRPAS